MRLLMLEQNAISAIESIAMIDEEKQILEHMVKTMKEHGGKMPEPEPEPPVLLP